MDNHDSKTRSYNMSKIRSSDTKPEQIVRKYLFSKGLRYRKNVRNLSGCPDIVLKKYNTVVFVNGCFWHKHEGCSKFVWPSSNENYWKKKILGNVKRDEENYAKLRDLGCNIVTVWECELKKPVREQTLSNLYIKIISQRRD